MYLPENLYKQRQNEFSLNRCQQFDNEHEKFLKSQMEVKSKETDLKSLRAQYDQQAAQ